MGAGAITFMLIVGLFLGLGAGFVMHRSDFCFAGMFRDLFLFRSLFKLRALLLLVVSSMVLFELARQLGLLSLYPFPLFGPPSLANVIGGFLFGIGMVLAGGCVVGSLYKMGAGSGPSAAAVAGLVAGSALYAEIHPWWRSVVSATTFLKGASTLPQVAGIDPFPMILAVAAIAAVVFYRWYHSGALVRPMHTEGSLQPWKAALLLSLISLVSSVVIGMPLGITTAYAKVAGYIESLLFADHVHAVAYFNTQPLMYRQPLTGAQLGGGPGPRMDAIALIQFPVIAGIVLGSALSTVMLKEFRMYLNVPLRQYLSAVVGGVIMGLGSRMTPACNIWHLLGGLPILALQSLLFLAGLLPGAWLGSRILSGAVIK